MHRWCRGAYRVGSRTALVQEVWTREVEKSMYQYPSPELCTWRRCIGDSVSVRNWRELESEIGELPLRASSASLPSSSWLSLSRLASSSSLSSRLSERIDSEERRGEESGWYAAKSLVTLSVCNVVKLHSSPFRWLEMSSFRCSLFILFFLLRIELWQSNVESRLRFLIIRVFF